MTPVAVPSPTPPNAANDASDGEKVVVSRSFVRDAEKAFDLVVEQKAALEKFLSERKATEEERKMAEALLKAIDKLLEIKDLTISTLENVVDIQSRAITTLAGVVEKLEKLNDKSKGFWQKLADGVKEALKAAGYILIGRGLS